MASRKKKIPASFDSPEEAGEFWDTHSAADYWDETEETEKEFDIKERSYQISLAERIYQIAKNRAEAERATVGEVVNAILEHAFNTTQHAA
jgi:hypothetical protein